MMGVILKNFCKDKDKTEKLLIYVFAPLTIMLILLSVFAMKGIYPFGKETVDYYDMGQEVVAVYHHIYDYLHGEKVPFFDWYTGLGMNMCNGTSGCNVFNPFNILLCLFARDKILEGMSFLLIIKLMLMAGTFGFFLRKQFPETANYIKYALCVGYGMCGFVMMHYTIMPWLDATILFPMLISGVIELIRNGKTLLYTISLTLILITNYYMSAMALVYIVFGTGLYIFSVKLSDRKSKTVSDKSFHLIQLGIMTILAFCIASFALIPQIAQVLSSTRFENNGGYLDAIRAVNSPYRARVWAILGLALPSVISMKGIGSDISGKRDGKAGRLIFVVGMIVIACAEMFVEGINLLLHFGSYVHYPIRNGFIIYFTVAAVAAFYSNKTEDIIIIKNIKPIINTLLTYACVIAGIAVSIAAIIIYSRMESIDISQALKITKILGAVFVILFAFAIIAAEGKKKWAVPAILIAQLVLYSFIFIGPIKYHADYMSEPEQEAEYIRICNQLSSKMEIEEEEFVRIKNPDTSLNSNYGFILRRSSLANMTHLISKGAQDGAVLMGYSIMFTRLLDSGGTEFTDALLHIGNIITRNELDGEQYNPVDSTMVTTNHLTGEENRYYYYSRNNILPFDLIVSNEEDLKSIIDAEDIVTFHNNTYRVLSNSIDEFKDNNKEFVSLVCGAEEGKKTIHLDGDKLLYFWGGCADQEYANMKIVVNGETVPVPTIRDYNNTSYPSHFNNNTLYIGEFKDTDIDIEIIVDHSVQDASYYAGFFSLDREMLTSLCDSANEIDRNNVNSVDISGNRVSCSVEGRAGNYLLVPVAYDKGFSATVNGQPAENINVKGLFTAIELSDGRNEVVLTYYPEGLKTGIAVTLTGTVLLLLVVLMNKKKLFETKIAIKSERILDNIYIALWAIAILAIYLIPTVANIIGRFT